jgi:hypothetical protein
MKSAEWNLANLIGTMVVVTLANGQRVRTRRRANLLRGAGWIMSRSKGSGDSCCSVGFRQTPEISRPQNFASPSNNYTAEGFPPWGGRYPYGRAASQSAS